MVGFAALPSCYRWHRIRPGAIHLFEQVYNWLQQIDWTHYITIGIAFTLLALIRGIRDIRRRQVATVQPVLSTTMKASITNNADSKSKNIRFHIHKLFPVLRWILFFIAVMMVLIGIQNMYAALNPTADLVRGALINKDPEISWTGAVLSATGIAILWFGRQWWSNKPTT